MATFLWNIKKYLLSFIWSENQQAINKDQTSLLLMESEKDQNDFIQFQFPSELTSSAYMLYYLYTKPKNTLEEEMGEFVEIV